MNITLNVAIKKIFKVDILYNTVDKRRFWYASGVLSYPVEGRKGRAVFLCGVEESWLVHSHANGQPVPDRQQLQTENNFKKLKNSQIYRQL